MLTLKLVIVLSLATLISWNCSSNSTTLTFENKSNFHIDSAVFSVNNSKYKLSDIAPNTTIRKFVKFDTIKLNNHDVMVMASIYLKDRLFRGGMDYNDLSGALMEEYILTLNPDSTTVMYSK